MTSDGSAAQARLPSQVLILGIVSLLTAISTAMILGVLPVFLVVVLGVQMTAIGAIEGLAGAAMSIAKIFSGAFSDWIGRRKPILLTGYGISAVVKLAFPLAESVSTVLTARSIDRIGKGIRDAPRDALVADITPRSLRGSSFGLRAALYTLGFVIGPLTASGLMVWSGNDFRLVFWVAIIPALVGIFLLAVGVNETLETRSSTRLRHRRFDRSQLSGLTVAYWWIVAIAALFALARFSQAFLVLKSYDIGVGAAFIPMIILILHVVFSAVAYPCGIFADHTSRRIQLMLAGLTLTVADVILAIATNVFYLALGAALWGLQMGLSYGLLKAAIADVAPEGLRGTAFGIYEFAIGLSTFLASVAAGVFWTIGGSSWTFGIGAVLAATTIVLVVVWPEPKATAVS